MRALGFLNVAVCMSLQIPGVLSHWLNGVVDKGLLSMEGLQLAIRRMLVDVF